MTKRPQGLWKAKPHTLAKLDILRRYLNAWFPILCSSEFDVLFYIDSCCGPGEYLGGESGSPRVAIKAASDCSICSNKKVRFYFIDKEQWVISHLNNLMLIHGPQYPHSFTSLHGELTFHLPRVLDELDIQYSNTVPLFVFIDGWGDVVPYDIVTRILHRKSSEVLILYRPHDALRNIVNVNVEQQRSRIVKFFGSDEVLDLKPERLLGFYEIQLRKCADYVCRFQMTDRRDNAIYHLFFAGNHRLGFHKMKAAMLATHKGGFYTFSESINNLTLGLFDTDELAVDKLRDDLCQIFKGHKNVSIRMLREYVLNNTDLLPNHLNMLLKRMEISGLVKRPVKPNGTTARSNTFPDDAIVDLPDHFCGESKCRIRP